MDPLSVTASVITLIQVSAQVTSSVYDFIKATRAADSRLSALHHELGVLGRFLGSVSKALTECHPRHLALGLDEDLWRQCEVAVGDCDVTLDELKDLVAKINSDSRSGGFLRKGKLSLNLSIHEKDISNCLDKIHKSNSALQTVIAVVNVSLSLRSNASQELILDELDRLKTAIDYALKTAGSSAHGIPHGAQIDTDVSRHLKTLGTAARHYHSAASTAATTVRDSRRTVVSGSGGGGGGGGGGWHMMQSDNASINGVMLPAARARVETFIRENEENDAESFSNQQPQGRRPVSSVFPAEPSGGGRYGDDEDDEDDNHHRMLFVEGLAELARESIANHEFAKAEASLKMALDDVHSPSEAMSNALKSFKTQLAVCYLLQRKLNLAENLVRPMLESKDPELISYNLLHAVSVAHLAKYNFEPALDSCTHVLKCKKRLVGDSHDEYQQALGLLAVIYDTRSDQKQGDPIRAEVFRRKLSPDFEYAHPRTEVEYLCQHPHLLRTVFGESFPYPWTAYPDGDSSLSDRTFPPSPVSPISPWRGSISSPVFENTPPMRRSMPTIRNKVQHSEKLDLDTHKEVFVPHVLIQKPQGERVTSAETAADAVSDEEGTLVPGEHDDTPPGLSRAQSVPSRSLSKKISRMLTTAIRRGKSSGDLENLKEEHGHVPNRQHDATASNLHPKSALSLRRKKPSSTTEKRARNPHSFLSAMPKNKRNPEAESQEQMAFNTAATSESPDDNETMQVNNPAQPSSVGQGGQEGNNEERAVDVQYQQQQQQQQQQTVPEVSGSSDGAHGYSELDVNERVAAGEPSYRKQQVLTFIQDFHQLHGHYGPLNQQVGQTSAGLGGTETKPGQVDADGRNTPLLLPTVNETTDLSLSQPTHEEESKVKDKRSSSKAKTNQVQMMTLDESCYMNTFRQQQQQQQQQQQTPHHHHHHQQGHALPPSEFSIKHQTEIPDHHQHTTTTPRRSVLSLLDTPDTQNQYHIAPQYPHHHHPTEPSPPQPPRASSPRVIAATTTTTTSIPERTDTTSSKRTDAADSGYGTLDTLSEGGTLSPWGSTKQQQRGTAAPRIMDTSDSHHHHQKGKEEEEEEDGESPSSRRKRRSNRTATTTNTKISEKQKRLLLLLLQTEKNERSPPPPSPPPSPSRPSRHMSSSSIQSDSEFFAAASSRRSGGGGGGGGRRMRRKEEEEEDDDSDSDSDEDDDGHQGVLL